LSTAQHAKRQHHMPGNGHNQTATLSLSACLCEWTRPQRPTSAADSTQSASQLAKAALKSCSITQQQLAGLDSAVPNAAGGAGALLFVDPELLQLEDQQQLHIMVQGLKVKDEAGLQCVLMGGRAQRVGEHSGSNATVLSN
jgi:hypothetical protein